jgi:hypothetical protein
MTSTEMFSAVTEGSMQNDIRQPRVLSIRDFARALGLQPQMIKKWLRLRRVSKVCLGRRVLIPVTEVDRLIAENLVPALSTPHNAVQTENSQSAA